MTHEIQKIYGDKKVMRYIGDGQIYAESKAEQTLQKILKRYKEGFCP